MLSADPAIHLCIGAGRSGTTWLYNNLLDRDDLFVPPVKEVRFWHGRRSPGEVAITATRAEAAARTAEAAEWLARWRTLSNFSPDGYRALMGRPDRPSIDISPIYSIMPAEDVERVAATLPASSKIVYLVRDPLDRLLSHLRLRLYLQGAFRGPVADGTLRHEAMAERMQARSDYESVASRWHRAFGHRFRIFNHSDLERDAPAFLTEICRFLGLVATGPAHLAKAETYFNTDRAPDRVSYAPPFSERQRAIAAQSLQPVTDRGYTVVPPDVAAKWQAKVASAAALTAPVEKDEPDDDFHRLLRLSESLGGTGRGFNEWQRRHGQERASLFGRATGSAPALTRFLRRETATKLFHRANLVRHTPEAVWDRAAEFALESRLPAIAGDEPIAGSRAPDLIAQFGAEREAWLFLRRKFFFQAQRAPALYVFQDATATIEAVAALTDALLALNPAHLLLWVGPGSLPGLEPLKPGLFIAHEPATEPDRDEQEGWTHLMHACTRERTVQALVRRAVG